MLFPSVKAAKKNLTIPAQRMRDPVALERCSGTVGFIIGLLGEATSSPHVCFPLCKVCLHFLLMTLNALVLRLIQVMERNICSVRSCSSQLPPVSWRGSWVWHWFSRCSCRGGSWSLFRACTSQVKSLLPNCTNAPSLYSAVDLLGLYNHTNNCEDFVVVNTKLKLHSAVTATI